jgi:hypothetical protein
VNLPKVPPSWAHLAPGHAQQRCWGNSHTFSAHGRRRVPPTARRCQNHRLTCSLASMRVATDTLSGRQERRRRGTKNQGHGFQGFECTADMHSSSTCSRRRRPIIISTLHIGCARRPHNISLRQTNRAQNARRSRWPTQPQNTRSISASKAGGQADRQHINHSH